MISVSRVLPALVLAAALLAQQADTSTFRASAKLVLVPFNVARGKNLAADLQPSDVILREDGGPRNFTIFQGPNTPNAVPLDMILLFDSTKYPASKAQRLRSWWDAKAAYKFFNSWDEPAMRAILEKNAMDIRISVYHYADRQFELLCNATRNPNELLQGFRRLLDPIPAGKGILTLLPGNDDPSARPVGAALSSSAWLWESIVASLNDATAASPGSARGVPIYPVILDRNKYVEHPVVWMNTRTPGPYDTEVEHPRSSDAPLWYAPASPASPLGDMTDGRVYFRANLDRRRMSDILDAIRDAELAKYVVGFVPGPSQAPRKRKLEVVLRVKICGESSWLPERCFLLSCTPLRDSRPAVTNFFKISHVCCQ